MTFYNLPLIEELSGTLSIVSASYAKHSLTASYAISTTIGPSVSASWSNQSLSASYVSNLITDLGNYNTEYGIVYRHPVLVNSLATNGGGTSLFAINPSSGSLKAIIFLGNLVGTASHAETTSRLSLNFTESNNVPMSSSIVVKWIPIIINGISYLMLASLVRV
jgi:hypothetical protein